MKHTHYYTDQNTRVKDLPVRLLRFSGIGHLCEIEVCAMWSQTYTEELINGGRQNVTKEFHPGQRIMVDGHRLKKVIR